jgi:hypothetical protein
MTFRHVWELLRADLSESSKWDEKYTSQVTWQKAMMILLT